MDVRRRLRHRRLPCPYVCHGLGAFSARSFALCESWQWYVQTTSAAALPPPRPRPRLLLNARAQAFRIRRGCCQHWLRRHCLCRCGCRRRRSKGGWLKGRGHSHSPLGVHALRGGGGLRKSGPAASTAPKCKSNFLGRFCCNVLSWASAKLEHKMHRMVLQDPESTTSFPQLGKHQRPSTRSRPKTGYARGGWCFRCF